MNDIQTLVETINDANFPDWRHAPIEHFVLGLYGERGEIANTTKKYSRHKMGWRGGDLSEEEFKERLKGEIPDDIIYACLICGKYGWDLMDLIKDKVKVLIKRFGWIAPPGTNLEVKKK